MKYLYMQAFSEIDDRPECILYPLSLPALDALVKAAVRAINTMDDLGHGVDRMVFNVGANGFPNIEPIWMGEDFVDPNIEDPDWELEAAVENFEPHQYELGILDLTLDPWDLAERTQLKRGGVFSEEEIDDRELVVYADREIRFTGVWGGTLYEVFTTGVSLETLQGLLAPLLEG